MRFTLKTMMVTVSVAAAICCVFFALPYWLSLPIIGLFWFMAPSAMIAGIVYGRGYQRAFAIGCASAGGILPIIYMYGFMILLSGFDGLDSLDDDGAILVKIAVSVFAVLVAASGLVSMGVRWFALPSEKVSGAPVVEAPAQYSVLHSRVTTMQVDSEDVAPEPIAPTPSL